MSIDPWVHRIAVAAITLGYIGIISVLGTLVLLLHDGEATRDTVAALQQLGTFGLVALIFIATGRPLFQLLGNMLPNAGPAIQQITTPSIQQIVNNPQVTTQHAEEPATHDTQSPATL